MALFRLEAKAISRGQGRSCIAAAAYRHATELRDERQQMTHSYTHKGGVAHSEIIAPVGSPTWVQDRERLWNALDAAEKRKDAITAREILVSLPRELNSDEQIELVRAFCKQFTERRIIADVAVHRPSGLDGSEQPHAHVMLADRPVDGSSPTGFAAKKDRTLATPDGIEAVRAVWADVCNAALERAEVQDRVDHRSLARQQDAAIERGDTEAVIALDREPEPKIGPTATAMVRAGRGDRAYSWRDVSLVRAGRAAAELAASVWRQVVAEAAALTERIAQAAAVMQQREELLQRRIQRVEAARLAREVSERTDLERGATNLMAYLDDASTELMVRDANRRLVERQAERDRVSAAASNRTDEPEVRQRPRGRER